MSEIFVAGDIHGNYQGLMESLNAAGWQEGDTIICVGDVTDRGKDNARTVSFLQEHECDVRLVQGNHELQHRKMLQYYHVLIKVPKFGCLRQEYSEHTRKDILIPKQKKNSKSMSAVPINESKSFRESLRPFMLLFEPLSLIH